VRPIDDAGGARWLSVGRIAPNKAIEDTIAALMVTRRHDDPAATLLIIGKPATSSYADALYRHVASLGLSDAVTFGGHASDATVAAAYAQADVLVVTSAHEGYCVPVVEAMTVGLPVVAFRQGALPEVLGAAGVLVDSRDPYALAATIATVVRDAPLRARLAEQAVQRLAELDLGTAADRFVTLLCGVQERRG
jgi:glycosyltransferase involved in cell wall biosynthesis